VERTAFNTAVLLLSGVLLSLANRYMNSMPRVARRYLEGAVGLGIAFVSLQGVEWVALLRVGLTLRSSSHGRLLLSHRRRACLARRRGHFRAGVGLSSDAARETTPAAFAATQVFWYFVVLSCGR